MFMRAGAVLSKTSIFKKEIAMFKDFAKKLICLALFCIIVVVSVMFINASLMVYADDIAIVVDGEFVQFSDAQPSIVDGRVLVPVRGVFEMMGYDISWNRYRATATLENDYGFITVRQGTGFITVDGERRVSDVPPQIIDGRFMVPLRLIAEATGAEVYWDGDMRTAFITTVPVVVESRYLEFSYSFWDIYHTSRETSVEVISNMDELSQIIARFSEREGFSTRMKEEPLPNLDKFVESLEEYNDEFFYDNVIVLVLFTARTQMRPSEITSISENGVITITRRIYEPMLPTYSEWGDNAWAGLIEVCNSIALDNLNINYYNILSEEAGLDFYAHPRRSILCWSSTMRHNHINRNDIVVITSSYELDLFLTDYYSEFRMRSWDGYGNVHYHLPLDDFDIFTELFFENYSLIIILYNGAANIRDLTVNHINEDGEIILVRLLNPPRAIPGMIIPWMFMIEIEKDDLPSELSFSTIHIWN